MSLDTEPGPFFERLRVGLEGHRVSYYRLACDTLLLYVDCQPGDDEGIIVWFEPIWHFRGPEGVLVGSRQVADVSETKEGMAAACVPMKVLYGRTIERISIEPATFDLSVSLEGGYRIATFVSDPTQEESWCIREKSTGMGLQGTPEGLLVVPAETRS
jgi:hypothetical protein